MAAGASKAVFTNLFMAGKVTGGGTQRCWNRMSEGGKKALIVEYLLERREDCNLKMKL